MVTTDIITLILSIFFLVRGFSRGCINSLTGPFSIIVTTIISIIYYQKTQNLTISLGIGLVGPLLLNLLLKVLIKTWAVATNSENPNFLSRIAGAILTIVWGWIFIFFALILITVLPPWGATLTAIHNDVLQSESYLLAAKPLEMTFFASSQRNITAVIGQPSSDDAKSLAQDPRFQQVLQDPNIQQDIQAHDIAKLMQNPKMLDLVRQVMSDPETMKKVLAIYSSQLQPQGTKSP